MAQHVTQKVHDAVSVKGLFDHLPYPPPGPHLAAKTVVLRSFLQERRDPYMLMLTPSVKVRGRG